MAKVGGRSAWIAWPAALLCVAVIGALLWLATPGVPAAVSFIGDTLRAATSPPSADGDEAQAAADAQPATDCRSLYPDPLWAELVWTPQVLLSQSASAPATSTTLAQALAPSVTFTCTWKTDDGRSISSTVAQVADGSAAVAQAALTSEGFSCALQGERVHCERAAGDVTEVHDLRGTGWLSSVLASWSPVDYAVLTASRVFTG